MPTPKKGLSPLARAQFGLEGKQIRRSVNEHNVKKSAVTQAVRDASLPEASEESRPEPQSEDKVLPDRPQNSTT
jgi:hypothetical protein